MINQPLNLKVGIIGSTDFDEKHFQFFEREDRLRVVGGLANQFYGDVEYLVKFIEESDAFFVYEMAHSDYKTLAELIKKGKHLFVKDFSLLSISDLKNLEKLAYEADVKVQFSSTHFFEPYFLSCLQDKKDVKILDLRLNLRAEDVNFNLSLIEHYLLEGLSYTIKIAGNGIKSIYATGMGEDSEKPDIVNIRLMFYNGCIATISASRLAIEKEYKINLSGSFDSLHINLLEKKWRTTKNIAPHYLADFGENRHGETKTVKENHSKNCYSFENELISFYNCILNDEEPKCNLAHLIDVQKIIQNVYDQLERNLSISGLVPVFL